MRVFFAIHVGDSLAHVYRSRDLARQLAQRGHEVCYPVPAWVRHHLDGYLPSSALRDSHQSYSFARYPVLSDRKTQVIQHARAEWDAFRTFEPDVVVGDTGLIAHAYRPRVPFLKILSRFYFEVGPDGLSPYSPEQLAVIAHQVEAMVNEAARGLGLPHTFQYQDLLAGDALLCADEVLTADLGRPRWTAAGFSAMVESSRGQRNPRVAFIGVGTGLAEHQAPVASRMLQQAEGLFERIYLSVGFGDGTRGLYVPRNAVVQERFSVLPEDTGVLISHGGLASLQLAQRARLPLLVVPLQVEQYSNAWHVERLGLGINCGLLPCGLWGGLDTRMDYSTERFRWAVGVAQSGATRHDVPTATTRHPLAEVVQQWLLAHS